MNLADLPDDAASGAGCGGNDESFAGLGLADFEKAEVGGEAVDAESAEEVGVGEKGNGRKLLKSAGFLASEKREFLKASKAHDLVARLEVGMAGFDDLGEAESSA